MTNDPIEGLDRDGQGYGAVGHVLRRAGARRSWGAPRGLF